MKGFREIAMIAALAVLASCNTEDEKKHEVPPGQISAKMINNPRTAAGDGSGNLQQFPELTFADTVHHFGTISAGEVVEHDFPFSNSGKSPLLIVGATSSCGCTAPQYPTSPIAPGDKGIIKVRFDSKGKQGHVLKAVTINTNGSPGTKYLTITADVTP